MMHKAPHFRAPARRLVPPTSWLLLDCLTRLVSRLRLLVGIRGKDSKSRVTCATRDITAIGHRTVTTVCGSRVAQPDAAQRAPAMRPGVARFAWPGPRLP